MDVRIFSNKREAKFSICLTAVLFLLCLIVLRNYLILGRPFLSLEALSDLIRANLPTYILMYDHITSGFGIWSWEMGLGTNMFSHADVFFDPFTYICFIGGRNNIGYMMGWSYAVKIILEGLAFNLYLKHFGMDERSRLLASIAYAFCGYSMIMGANLALGTVLVYFPIVLLGIERYLEGRSKLTLIIALTLIGFLSPYYFYVSGLFSIIYLLVRCKMMKKNIVRPILGLALCGLVSAALSSPSLLTQISLGMSSPRVSSGGKDVSFDALLFLPDVLSSISLYVRSFGVDLLGTYDQLFVGRRYGGDGDFFQSELYIGCIAIPFILHYIFQRAKDKRKTILILILSFIAVTLPLVSYVFTTFSTINFRWMFTLDIILCLFFAISYADAMKNGINLPSLCKIIGVSVVLFTILIYLMFHFSGADITTIMTMNIGYRGADLATMLSSNWQYYLITILTLAALIAAVYFYRKESIANRIDSAKLKQYLAVALTVILSVNIVANYCGWYNDGNSVSSFENGSTYGYDDASSRVIAEITENDTSFFRVYKDFDSVYDYNGIPSDNDAMAQGYYGLKNYNSLGNAHYINFLQTMGVYVACPPLIEQLKERGIEPKDITGSNLNYVNGIDDKYNLLSYLGVKYFLTKSGSGNPIPAGFVFSHSSDGIDVYTNSSTYSLAFVNSHYIKYDDFMNLSYDDRNTAIMSKTVIYKDYNVTDTATPSTCTLVNFSDDYLKFNVDIHDGNQIVSFSIPYDSNWKVYVDGKQVDSYEVNVGLTGAEVPEGTHVVELRYVYKDLSLSLIIVIVTAAAILIVASIRIVSEKKKHGQSGDNEQ